MVTEILGGLLIGLLIEDWLGRVVMPAAFGLWACFELRRAMRSGPLKDRQQETLKAEGATKRELEELQGAMGSAAADAFSEAGLTGWKLYGWEFAHATAIALVFSVVGGLLREFVF